MVRFIVDPDALRAMAQRAQSIRDAAGSLTETCTADVGHEGLADAISRLAAQHARAWSAAGDDLEHVAERLRRSADLYETTDQEFARPGMRGVE